MPRVRANHCNVDRRGSLSLPATALLVLSGCAPGTPQDGVGMELIEPDSRMGLRIDAGAPALDAGAPLEDAGGHDDAGDSIDGAPPESVSIEVSANGTGCPAGTWDASVSPDGTHLRASFSQFEASVSANKSVDVKDCIISLRVHSPPNFSYALRGVRNGGYAFLGPGVQARLAVAHWFQGERVPESDIDGPLLDGKYDREYSFVDNAVGDHWSPCGQERELNILTRVSLRNASPESVGYISLLGVDFGSPEGLAFAFDWRACPKAPATTPR